MKISYAITVCNEFIEIQKLLTFLLKHKGVKDEIVILYDNKNGDKELLQYLLKFNKLPNVQTWRGLDFEGHFAEWKNKLTEYCSGDYIFQIDADELPHEHLIQELPGILEENPQVELIYIPRINTVEGLTKEHTQKWGWNVNEKGWVNFPDVQGRVYKNNTAIRWKNKVHEVITGHKIESSLPPSEEWCLYHPKEIKRQEKQNEYYNTL
jgi:hypothetical protein